MSLAQHVTEYEGYDREDPRVDDNASGVPPWATPQLHAIHRVLSYDAFPPLEREVTLKEEYGGITQYNVSLYKRIGTFFVLSPDFFVFGFLLSCSVGVGCIQTLCHRKERMFLLQDLL